MFAARSLTSKRIHAINIRCFSIDRFQRAVEAMKASEQKSVSNEEKLKLYALYKQAVSGACTGSRPSVFSPVDRAKFDAWQALGKFLPNSILQLTLNQEI